MRIPKRVNAAWDWAERHGRALSAGTILLIITVGALWLPALGALVAGMVVGGVLVHRRMRRRLGRLQADNDQLLRQTGALRHKIALLEQGVRRESSVTTQRLPFIPGSVELPEASEAD
ncbi:hypothetical protein [Actinocorallia populi]|uniref:hypothetical protein n=1 Tax=Actinocorallia populi TaxID=2079200 RepID=UPI000D096CDC|nr:hypothetical protein [Actinocorallia populi]